MVSLVPGDVLLGKYRVERILGKGGMGLVVAARHLDLDELFAIKLLVPGEMDKAEAEERFLREARAAARLKGEHVARVQDVGRLPDGTPFMVMEHLDGMDLRRLVRSVGPPAVGDAVAYALQICETLREAHALGIVHRDVKCANIFLTHRPNGSACIKVLDFGLSKQADADAVRLTTTGMVGGSPFYMSPEQIRSTKHVDHRTDVWSLGVVLYELLTGTTPFQAGVMTAVVGRVLNEEPAPPSKLRQEVPGWLDEVVLRCLVKAPEGRFSSMDEVMGALMAEAPAEWVSAAGVGVHSSRSPGVLRISTVPASSPGASSMTGGFSQSAGASGHTGTAVRRSRRLFALVSAGALVLGVAAGAAVWLRPAGVEEMGGSAGPGATGGAQGPVGATAAAPTSAVSAAVTGSSTASAAVSGSGSARAPAATATPVRAPSPRPARR